MASEPRRFETTALVPYQSEAEEPTEGEIFAYSIWLMKRPAVAASSRQVAEYVCSVLETGHASSATYTPTGKQLEYAERLLEYFKVARVLAPNDERLAAINRKLDSILPYVASKLYEEDEVAEPEDPELAKIGNFVVKQVREPYNSPGHIELEDPSMVDRVWKMVQTFRYYTVPHERG